MVMRSVVLTLVMLVLSGCYDRFSGPGLQNALDWDIELSVTYTDGKIMHSTWSSGRLVLVGRGDLPNDGIKEIVVKDSGKIIHQLNREEVRVLVERQRSHRARAIWCVDRESIYLFEPNPPDTGGCSKGKRIE